MTTYDAHQHLWPEPLVAALEARSEPPCLRGDVLTVAGEGSSRVDPAAYGLSACLGTLDRDGIDVAIVSCPPTLGIEALAPEEAEPLLDAYHDGAREAVAEAEGRVLALSMSTPREGFVGTSIGAPALGDLELLAPVFDEVERHGGFLFVHPAPGAPPIGAPPWWAGVVGYTVQMQTAYAAWLADGVRRWPTLRVLFAILAGGAPFQIERLQSRGGDSRETFHPTLYLDTASYGRRALEFCLAAYGATQLVYGSDAPVLDPRVSLDPLRSFGPAASEAMCSTSPTALLA